MIQGLESFTPKYHGIFDSHAHYNDDAFNEDRDELLSSLSALGVKNAICVGYDLPSSEKAVAIAEKYPAIYAAVGFHPENLEEYSEDGINLLRPMLVHPKTVAIGEIGLDYHWKEMPPDLQQRAFTRQLSLAREMDMPVIIHAREATEDTLAILKDFQDVRGVVHCFSGSAETAKILAGWGFYIGFTGVLTFKNARHPVEACGVVPKEQLLLETDCPYMAPVPWRGKRSSSPMIQSVAERMAEIKGVSPQEIIDITAKNARTLFRIGEKA